MVTHRQAKVRIVNDSGKPIEPNSIIVGHKYSDVYKNELKFSKGLAEGETDDGGGSMIVDYHTGFLTTGVDWWLVTWVTADDKTIYQTNPANGRGFIDQLEGIVPGALAAAATVAGDAVSGPLGGVGAGIAADYISKCLMNDEKTVGFKRYFLTASDDSQWVTITIKRNSVLTFESPTGDATTQYHSIKILPNGSLVG